MPTFSFDQHTIRTARLDVVQSACSRTHRRRRPASHVCPLRAGIAAGFAIVRDSKVIPGRGLAPVLESRPRQRSVRALAPIPFPGTGAAERAYPTGFAPANKSAGGFLFGVTRPAEQLACGLLNRKKRTGTFGSTDRVEGSIVAVARLNRKRG